MNQQEINLLMLKRALCKPYMVVNDNRLARALQAKVAAGDPRWTVHGGKHVRSRWGNEATEPITREEFIHTKKTDGSWDHEYDLLCTFNGMIDVEVITDEVEGDLVRIAVQDGESLTGHHIGLRCHIYLKGPWWTIKDFRECIETRWVKYTTAAVQAEELLRLEQRRLVVAEELLAGTYEVNTEEG